MAYNTHKDLVKFESKLLSFISNPKSIFHRESTKKTESGNFLFFFIYQYYPLSQSNLDVVWFRERP